MTHHVRETRSESEETDAEPSIVDGVRRNVLRALGTGTALAATGGVASGAGTGGGHLFDMHDDTANAEIDPQFGFPAASGEVEPPVEPDHEIEVMIRPREGAPIPEFFFRPTGLYVEPGDTVQWTFVTGHHTVSAYHPGFGFHRRVPEGVPPFSSPVMPQGGYWLYTFEEPGVYDYHCGHHEVFGHTGRIVVGSAESYEPLPDLCASAPPAESGGESGGEGEGGSDGEDGDDSEGGGEGEELRLPLLTAHTVLSDESLSPECIVREGAQPWSTIDPENKQLFVSIRDFPPCGSE